MRFDQLFRSIKPDNIAAFRILFGGIMLWEVNRYFDYDWIFSTWVDPIINFKYGGFFWVQPLAGDGMFIVFYLLGALSLFIMIGFLYRISTVLFFFLFTYIFLLEQAGYLNHFYLVVLISFLMMFIPAHRTFSIDAWLFPKIRREWIPNWTLMLLRFQIGIVYFFGGIAKLNSDWLAGSPMDMWLPGRSDFPLIGQYFHIPEVVLFISYSGLLLDLLAFPLLMYRKTRPWIALSLLLFHLINDRLFSIGIFPWFMIGALVIYLPASWPRQFFAYLKKRSSPLLKYAIVFTALASGAVACWFHEDFSLVPFLCGLAIAPILFWDFHKYPVEDEPVEDVKVHRFANLAVTGLAIWVFLQIVVPLRHYFIPGNSSWTEEGHRFAWHMKLRSKSCDLQFYIANSEASEKTPLDAGDPLYSWQYEDMENRPQLIAQYAKILSSANNNKPIYADVACSLNGGPRRQLINPDVDLTEVRFHDWKRNDWILIY